MPDRRNRLLWIPTAIAVVLGALFLWAYRPDLPLNDLKARYSDATSQFVTLHGMPVHYRDEGSGPALVLLHGMGASLHTWDAWIDTLKYDYRVIRMDLPGFGLTGPAADGDYSIERYVRFLDEFRRRLNIDRFHLAGNALGGKIAWHYALAHADNVDRLVLIDAAGYPAAGTTPAAVPGVARLPFVSWLFTLTSSRQATAESLRMAYAQPARISDETVDRYYELSLRPGNRRAFVERALDAAEDPVRDHREISQPTLVLWGAEDRRLPVANAHGFMQDIKNARLRIFPGVGHLPMEELPGPSARAVLTFLRDRGGDSAEASP